MQSYGDIDKENIILILSQNKKNEILTNYLPMLYFILERFVIEYNEMEELLKNFNEYFEKQNDDEAKKNN